MIVWGWRSYVQSLAMLTFLCGNCGNPSMHHVKRAFTKFTLFWIPLFPVSSKYYTECTFCGVTHKVTKEEALRLGAQANQPDMQPQPQQFQQQPMQGGYPQQQYPQSGGFPQQPQHPQSGGFQQPGYPQQQHPQSGGFPQPGYPQQQPQQGYAPQQGYPQQRP